MDSTTLTRPVVTDVHAAAELMATAAGAVRSVWQLGDGDVEHGLSLLVRLQAQHAPPCRRCCWPRPSPGT